MKIVKYIFGMLAGLYALALLFRLIALLVFGNLDFSKPYAQGMIGGGISGICIGTAIAVGLPLPQ